MSDPGRLGHEVRSLATAAHGEMGHPSRNEESRRVLLCRIASLREVAEARSHGQLILWLDSLRRQLEPGKDRTVCERPGPDPEIFPDCAAPSCRVPCLVE